MDDKENYIRMLEQKRDTEIPEIINELRLQLDMRKKEKVDIDLEIQHLRATENRKTIFDLPVLGWQEVTRNLIHPQNEIHALSLSSGKMTEVLDTVFQGSSKSIKMEKAFTILLTNFYLDCTDLLNCIETTCEDLGKVASRTWHFLENPNYQFVNLNAIGSYQDFRVEAECKRAEHKIWTCFAGKIIRLNLTGRFSDNWNESKEFLQEYGYFCVNIEFSLEAKDLEATQKTDCIHNMLLDGKLPNVLFFHVQLNHHSIYKLRAQVDTRSLQNYFCLLTHFLLTIVENKKRVLKLPGLIAEAWNDNQSRCVVSFKQLRSLSYELTDEKLKKRVTMALKNCLSHTKDLQVSSHDNIRDDLQFAETFPALSKILIYSGHRKQSPTREDFIIPSNIRLPTVQTLTYELCGGPIVPHLSDIMSAFPSLRCVNLKTGRQRDEFIVLVKGIVKQAEKEANNVNGYDDYEVDSSEDFDIFQRLSNGQPLTESDIWTKVPKLNVFCLITRTLLSDHNIKSNMVEKYTRDFGDRKFIRVEKYMEGVANQFPN